MARYVKKFLDHSPHHTAPLTTAIQELFEGHSLQRLSQKSGGPVWAGWMDADDGGQTGCESKTNPRNRNLWKPMGIYGKQWKSIDSGG
jgi:hypothetical protein